MPLNPLSKLGSVAWGFGYCFFPNLPFVVVAYWLSIHRAWINLDYLFPAILLILGWRVCGVLLITAVFCLDVILTVLTVFFNNGDFISFDLIATGLMQIRRGPLLLLGMALIVMAGFAAISRRHTGRLTYGRFTLAVIAGLMSLLTCLDVVNGSSMVWLPGRLGVKADIVYTSVGRLVRKSLSPVRDIVISPLTETAAASSIYLNVEGIALAGKIEKARHEESFRGLFVPRGHTNLVMIMVESLGSLRADPARKMLFAPLLRLTGRYEISSGMIDTLGGTVSGELRELCWVRVNGIDMRKMSSMDLSVAMLRMFADNGYETISYHGFYGMVFNRQQWYPRIGFQHSVFLEQMQADDPDLPLTGMFLRGATDEYVGSLISKRLRENRRLSFIYWITLTGHLPVNSEYSAKLTANSVAQVDSRLPRAIGEHELIHQALMRKIASIASDPALPACDFLIVGDHPPPFGLKALQGGYLERRVPYLILRHRGQN